MRAARTTYRIAWARDPNAVASRAIKRGSGHEGSIGVPCRIDGKRLGPGSATTRQVRCPRPASLALLSRYAFRTQLNRGWEGDSNRNATGAINPGVSYFPQRRASPRSRTQRAVEVLLSHPLLPPNLRSLLSFFFSQPEAPRAPVSG